jgi:hypothetical protein
MLLAIGEYPLHVPIRAQGWQKRQHSSEWRQRLPTTDRRRRRTRAFGLVERLLTARLNLSVRVEDSRGLPRPVEYASSPRLDPIRLRPASRRFGLVRQDAVAEVEQAPDVCPNMGDENANQCVHGTLLPAVVTPVTPVFCASSIVRAQANPP